MDKEEMIRQQMEDDIVRTVGALECLLSTNAARPYKFRVQTVTNVTMDGDRFLVVGGSAHQMGECFREMFRKRPELVSVVRRTLKEMFVFEGD